MDQKDHKTSYDALLLVSFGGPEGMDDVMPFLENVLRGKNVPAARMEAVAQHYEHFGGVSPINEQNRKLIAALKPIIQDSDLKLPIYWGNRNWHPLLTDTVRQMAHDGIKRALAFVTSAYSSYSSCRQYQENIRQAQAAVGATAPQIDKIRSFYNHPGFIEPNAENLLQALESIPMERRQAAQIAFSAHSIPLSMASGCEYANQLLETSHLVAELVGCSNRSQLVYQSRSGSRTQPWLEPNILDHITELKEKAISDLIIAPIGFISDHMEVLYDLDTEAKELCDALGINLVRAATVGTHPRFIKMIKELVEERIDNSQNRLALGYLGPSHDLCPPDCCLVTS